MTMKTTQTAGRNSKPGPAPFPTPEEIAEMMERSCCGPMMLRMKEHCLRPAEREKNESSCC
jgi:hypothetical protein